MAQDCSAALREKPVRKNLDLNTDEPNQINLLIWNKLYCSLIIYLRMYSQIGFINKKTKQFTYFCLLTCAYFLQYMLLEWVKACPKLKNRTLSNLVSMPQKKLLMSRNERHATCEGFTVLTQSSSLLQFKYFYKHLD